MMKLQLVLVLLLGLCLQVSSAINEAQMKAARKLIRNTCRTKTKISDEQIEDMHKGIWNDDDDVTKCYTHCCMGIMKMQNKHGGFDRELAAKQYPQIPESMRESLVSSLEGCADSGEGLTKKCDISYAFFKCVYFSNPEEYILP
uniref:Odorant-binding protein 8 n=1 Tax=Holotrichia oblita TaxID=644536 RepID=A0A3S8S959_HOLOL|nr:odorant binding protein 8 [Holotrichia oblita]AZZ86674.1 odorant-binding protein 8 [Holotrichia oblita]